MRATSIAPLRKTDTEGKVYTRLPETESRLVELYALSRDDLAARCAIQDRDDKDYVPSECLVTLVREHRSRPLDACSEVIFRALLERVLRGLPQTETCNGEDLTQGNVRDEARFRFLKMLGEDRQVEYVEALDYFEVRFQDALASLRVNAQRYVYRRENPLDPVEIDPETGELSEKVEKAAGMFDPFDSKEIGNFDYRSQLDAAIDDLPGIQKAIIEMIRQGIPIESKETGKVNISNVLGKTPKTIAAHRYKAYAKLRTKMTKGE
jgi:hypothetical protein